MANNIYFNIKRFITNEFLIDNKCIKTLIRQWDGSALYDGMFLDFLYLRVLTIIFTNKTIKIS